jgi:hypothetical protein
MLSRSVDDGGEFPATRFLNSRSFILIDRARPQTEDDHDHEYEWDQEHENDNDNEHEHEWDMARKHTCSP